MNGFFIAAGVFLFVTFWIHFIQGGKEYRTLHPAESGAEPDNMFVVWLMGHGTFQMVSVDLFLTSLFIGLMGFGMIPFNLYLSIFIALLYLGYLIFWLAALLFSKAKPVHYLKVGQWSLFIVAFLLIAAGIRYQV